MDFREFCDKLEEEYCQLKENNKVSCAEKFIENYVKDDREKLLELKAVVLDNDYFYYSAEMLSLYALFISVISLFMNSAIISILSIVFAIVLFRPQKVFAVKYKNIRKWRNCILVAIESLMEKK